MKTHKIYKNSFQGISFIMLIIIILACSQISCKKYLDAKPNKTVTTPSTLEDLTKLMDNVISLNQSDASSGEASADDYYLPDANFNNLMSGLKQLYTWGPDPFSDYASGGDDWTNTYGNVYITNTVLDILPKIERTELNQAEYDRVKGSALFFRGRFFLKLAGIFAKTYDATTAKTDLGLALRLNSNFNETSKRASVEETYQQIITDLKLSVALLPDRPNVVTRPSKAAAYGTLAEVFLSMRDHSQAMLYADSCLSIYNKLLDYNALNTNDDYPFQNHRDEVVFQSCLNTGLGYPTFIVIYSGGSVDHSLISSYGENDLRKSMFFAKGDGDSYVFKGSYYLVYPDAQFFSGIATDEMYLIRAEGYARQSKTNEALKDLNYLTQRRYKTGTPAFKASSSEEALNLILQERRKELVFRGQRWTDIKRLNKEGYNISLKRFVNGETHTLSPNDNRFALPIPINAISLSGMPQNPR